MRKQTGRYMRYAIGEIILVVIGILIAIQINNWRENVSRKEKETVYLKELNREFKENYRRISTEWANIKVRVIYCDMILAKFPLGNQLDIGKESDKLPFIRLKNKGFHKEYKIENINYKLLKQAMNMILMESSLILLSGSINLIMASNDISIISDLTLRSRIVSWNDYVERYMKKEIESNEQCRKFMSFYNAKIKNANPKIAINAIIENQQELYNYIKSRRDNLWSTLYSLEELTLDNSESLTLREAASEIEILSGK